MNKHNCRICGLYIDEPPWGEQGDCPTYEICPCCGVEFGNEDYTIESAKQYRINWVSKGSKWFDSDQKPPEWDMQKQLTHVRKDFL